MLYAPQTHSKRNPTTTRACLYNQNKQQFNQLKIDCKDFATRIFCDAMQYKKTDQAVHCNY